MKIVLAGCTGFIGKNLQKKFLEDNHELILLTRNPDSSDTKIKQLLWDGVNLDDWKVEVDGADAIVNLSGAGIADKRWSKNRKDEIYDSRIHSTHAIVSAIEAAQKKPSVLVNASAVGYYGNVDSGEVTEASEKGFGFLADVCDDWEKETFDLDKTETRRVNLRIGVVLEKNGGAIKKMLPPFLMFAGGPLGSGKQWMPWIHRSDVVDIILFCLQNSNIDGAVNACAPNPVTMKEFSSAFGKTIHRPSWAPVPGFMLKLMLGEMADMLLGGQKAIPKKLTDAGFAFRYPTIEKSLESIFHTSPQ